MPSGSTSFSNRLRSVSRAGRVRAARSRVRAQEISAAMRLLMSLAMGGSASHDVVVVTACPGAARAAAVAGEHLGA